MTLTTRIYTMLRGQLVGRDAYGNCYYRKKGAAHGSKTDSRKHEQRWVVYKGMAEPSKVPAEWHGWLHYTTDLPPTEKPAVSHAWQQEHMPNLTGTTSAYLPAGHLAKGGHHAATVAEVEPWQPN